MGRTARHNLNPAHMLADAAALTAADLALHINLKAGSTKGKKPERILTGTSVPNTLLKILLIMTLPEVKVISLSTISASYWKNALS